MIMFLSSFFGIIDSKNRISIPSSYRGTIKETKEKVYLFKSLKYPCLEIHLASKINSLVKSVFGEQESFESDWAKNQKVQQQLKSILNASVNKPLKDPDAPKRGKSSYLFFCGDMRDSVKEKLGDQVSATSITKELGQMWNELKSSTKASDKSTINKYQKMAQADKDRYESEKEAYLRRKTERGKRM